jgi:hypothetical protein
VTTKPNGAALSDPELLSALRSTPAVIEAEKNRKAAVADERKSLAAGLAKLNDEATKPYARERHESLVLELAEAKKRVVELQAQVGAAFNGRMGESAARDVARLEFETKLRATASPLLGQFVAEMWQELEDIRKLPAVSEVSSHKNPITGKTVEKPPLSTGAARTLRTHAVRRAIEDAELMMLAADQSDVPAKLAQLKDALPSANSLAPHPKYGTVAMLNDLRAGMSPKEAMKEHCS